MTLPTDPTLTKLRMLAARERRKLEKLQAEELQQSRIYEEKWLAFVARCAELGYCAACEKTKEECECVLIATNLKGEQRP